MEVVIRMNAHLAIDPNDLPTVEQIKKQYRYCRGLNIDLHQNGRVETISYQHPCEICGKCHRCGSKAEIMCNLKLCPEIYGILNKK